MNNKILSLFLAIFITTLCFSVDIYAISGYRIKNVPGTHMSKTNRSSGYLQNNIWHTTHSSSEKQKDRKHSFEYQVSAYYHGMDPMNVSQIKTTWCMAVKNITTSNSVSIGFSVTSGSVSASTTTASAWTKTASKYWLNYNTYTSSWRDYAYIYGKYADMYVENTAYTYYAGVPTPLTYSI